MWKEWTQPLLPCWQRHSGWCHQGERSWALRTLSLQTNKCNSNDLLCGCVCIIPSRYTHMSSSSSHCLEFSSSLSSVMRSWLESSCGAPPVEVESGELSLQSALERRNTHLPYYACEINYMYIRASKMSIVNWTAVHAKITDYFQQQKMAQHVSAYAFIRCVHYKTEQGFI